MKDSRGFRQVCGCVCVRPSGDGEECLLLSSRRRPGQWVLPKGGREKGETEESAAMRETWEEAGVRGRIVRKLSSTDEPNAQRPSTFHFFQLQVEHIADDWPEVHERERYWCPIEEAMEKVNREAMRLALAELIKK